MTTPPEPPFSERQLDLSYPCSWGYRIIGAEELLLRAAVATVMGDLEYSVFEGRVSSGGRYCSIEIEVMVESEEQRHALFHALAGHADIRYVL